MFDVTPCRHISANYSLAAACICPLAGREANVCNSKSLEYLNLISRKNMFLVHKHYGSQANHSTVIWMILIATCLLQAASS